MDKLERCPFCGGEAKIENNDRTLYDRKTLGVVGVEYNNPECFWIKCMDCDAFVGGFETEEEAIAAWNRRADGWVSVEKNIYESECICIGNQKEILIGYIYKDKYSNTGYSATHENEVLMHVTHWMQLPQPPKGE